LSNLPINSPIKGPGLTKPGVVILQFVVIFFFEAIEILFRNSLGIITCLAIWIAFFGAIYLGRAGTAYVTAVAPPISLLISSILLMPTLGESSFAPSSVGDSKLLWVVVHHISSHRGVRILSKPFYGRV
jgi:competence transcription factor ComK